jgi:hypothetical protein
MIVSSGHAPLQTAAPTIDRPTGGGKQVGGLAAGVRQLIFMSCSGRTEHDCAGSARPSVYRRGQAALDWHHLGADMLINRDPNWLFRPARRLGCVA